MSQQWQAGIIIAGFIYMTIEFVLIKGFGKKAFMMAFFIWLNKMLHSNQELKNMLSEQNAAAVAQMEALQIRNGVLDDLAESVKRIENEVRFNGGKRTLVDAVKDILNNQCIYASERDAALYIDAMPMFKTNTAGGLVFVNAAYLQMLGCEDEEEIMGMGFMVAVPEDQKDIVEKTIRRFASSPAPYNGEFTYRHLKSGDLIKTAVRTQLIRDSNGVFVGTLGTVKILNQPL